MIKLLGEGTSVPLFRMGFMILVMFQKYFLSIFTEIKRPIGWFPLNQIFLYYSFQIRFTFTIVKMFAP